MPTLPLIHNIKRTSPSRLFNIEQLSLEFSNGEKRLYERLVPGDVGAVIVVPIIDAETILLIREYAAGIHAYEVGLPKGGLEANESILDAANRELKEEAGFGARQLDYLTSLSLAPGYMTHHTHIVLARDLYPESLPGDEPEEIETLQWPIARIGDLVNRTDCSEGRSLAALYLARDFLEGKWQPTDTSPPDAYKNTNEE